MLTTVKQALKISVIALGFIITNSVFAVDAQTRSSDSFEFEQLQTGKNANWSFSSEDETISIQDNLLELNEISISDSDGADVRLIDENNNQPWGNRGDKEAYSFEAEIYDY
ncbi:MAG: hypothetical protein AAFQ14_14420 [Cyanobacteria bacterium J06621_12]